MSLDHSLNAIDAVKIALWNNPGYWSALADLGISKADLVDARSIPNPNFSFLFPGGPKQLEATLTIPIALLEMPSRIGAAKFALKQTADRLLQEGLGLQRDVLVAFADYELAERVSVFRTQEASFLSELAGIREAQANAGNLSADDARVARAVAANAAINANDSKKAASLARVQLLHLMGINPIDSAIQFDMKGSPIEKALTEEFPDELSLLERAQSSRPDLYAARHSMISAAKSAHWEAWKLARLTGVADSDLEAGQNIQFGPGAKFDIPIFNQNQAGRLRANAKVEKAAADYVAKRLEIQAEVKNSYVSAKTARDQLVLMKKHSIRTLTDSVRRSQQAFEIGRVRYEAIIIAQRALIDAQVLEAQQVSTLRKSMAQLAYAAGGDLSKEMPEVYKYAP